MVNEFFRYGEKSFRELLDVAQRPPQNLDATATTRLNQKEKSVIANSFAVMPVNQEIQAITKTNTKAADWVKKE